jgi:putative addiction module component (TIGR02574 family)
MNTELINAIKALPRDEKVQLIGEVWESLDDSFDPPLSTVQKDELIRRVKQYADNPADTVSWDEVKQRGRQMLAEIERSRK